MAVTLNRRRAMPSVLLAPALVLLATLFVAPFGRALLISATGPDEKR